MESRGNLSYEDVQGCYDRLKEYFPRFLELANEELKSYGLSQNVVVYYSYALQYNLQGGKMLRGTMVVATVKALCGGSMSEYLWAQTLTTAWCVELLQTSFLVADDIMDQSTKRRSNTCWYLVPTIGVSNAINDVMFLYTLIYRVLFRVFKDSAKLLEILGAFNRVAMTTILGQHMDTYECNNDRLFQDPPEAVRLFEEIAKNKTAYYSFYLPIKLGMLLADLDAGNLFYSRVESVCILTGRLFQVRAGAHAPRRRTTTWTPTGTRTSSGRSGRTYRRASARGCSPRYAERTQDQALTLATEEQRRLIRENIGSSDAARVAAVKALYEQMQLEAEFRSYAAELEREINGYVRADEIQENRRDRAPR